MSDTPKPLPQDSRNSPVTLASLSSVLDQGIKLVGLAYGIGFVVIMTHTARLNAPVVEALQFQNIVAGLPVWVLVLILLWLWRDYSEKLRYRQESQVRSIRTAVLIVVTSLAVLLFVVFRTIKALSGTNLSGSLTVLITSGVMFLFTLVMMIQAIREDNFQDPRVRPFFEVLCIWSGAVFLTVSYALFLYPIIPQSWGGGHPTQVQLTLKDPEVAALLNKPQIEPAPPEHNANVDLYYRSSSYLLVSNYENHLVHVPMDEVRGIVWMESTSR